MANQERPTTTNLDRPAVYVQVRPDQYGQDRPRKRRKKRGVKDQNLVAYLFMAPWILGFLVFTAGALVYTIFLSFNEVTLSVRGWETTFTGLSNYGIALLRNAQFVPALVSFIISEVTYAPTIVIVAFILALLLNRKMKARSLFRTLYFLPVIVLSGPVMYQLMDAGNTASLANDGLQGIVVFKMVANYSRILADGLLFLFGNFSMVLWFTGIPIILFINGLQKINPSIYEAAQIDAATPWQILWDITIPIIRPIAAIITIFTIVQLGLYSTNPVFTMIQEAIYNTVSGLGMASAYAWIYSMIILILIGVSFIFVREKKDIPPVEVKRLPSKGGIKKT